MLLFIAKQGRNTRYMTLSRRLVRLAFKLISRSPNFIRPKLNTLAWLHLQMASAWTPRKSKLLLIGSTRLLSRNYNSSLASRIFYRRFVQPAGERPAAGDSARRIPRWEAIKNNPSLFDLCCLLSLQCRISTFGLALRDVPTNGLTEHWCQTYSPRCHPFLSCQLVFE